MHPTPITPDEMPRTKGKMMTQATHTEREFAEISTILNSRVRNFMSLGSDQSQAIESAIALVRGMIETWAEDQYDSWNAAMQQRHEVHLDNLECEQDSYLERFLARGRTP
jgi:hypothetical protein